MRKNKGFTLIELMVIAAIIGIIAAVVAPHLQGLYQSHHNGLGYAYVATQYSADGKVVNTFEVKTYYTDRGTAYLTLKDGSSMILNGTYNIKEVRKN